MAAPGNATPPGITPEQWRRAGDVFHAALDRPEAERLAWAREACPDDPAVLAEVISLLESDAAMGQGYLAAQIQPAMASLLDGEPGLARPTRAGPYKLVRELGHGGMGTVYLGERDDDEYNTQVAIKLVRRGLDTELVLSRFYRERQTLARLQHPNIARLLDGGTTPDGSPYIVMEYVEGVRITDYCRDQGLSIPQRLSLFLNVCKAVDYAHRHFVVHRDLKPGNVLVNQSGEVKLLDFGICKLLQTEAPMSDDTMEAGRSPMTPDYASPEQILGEPITVASDVYSLGAVLYELLTGARPHRIETYTLQSVERAICEGEVIRPSLAAERHTARQLEGDLDNILLRALQKDTSRRYVTVEQLAEDIRRHLAHEPVLARPDSLAYRTRKFLRRRRGTVAAAASVVVALGGGMALSLRSARIANENLSLVRQLSNTFVFDVYDSVRDLPGATNARALIVRTGLEYLDKLSRNSSGDASLQRELAGAYRRIGDVQGNVMGANLGNTAEAKTSYGKALTLLEAVRNGDPSNRDAALERVVLHQRLGTLNAYTRDMDRALATLEQGRREGEALQSRFPGDREIAHRLAEVLNAAGEVKRRRGDYEAARTEFANAIELLAFIEPAGGPAEEWERVLAVAYGGVGQCDQRLGRLQEALDGFRKAAERLERLARLNPTDVALQRELMFTYSHQGDVLGNPNLRNLGDEAAAAKAYRQMAAVAQRLFDADKADHRAISDYGISLSRASVVIPESENPSRIAMLAQSVELLEEAMRKNPGNSLVKAELAYAYNFLGDAHLRARDSDRALRAFRSGLELAESALATGTANILTAAVLLARKRGELLATQGNRAASLAAAHRALELAEPGNPSAPPRTANVQRALTPRGYAAMGSVYAKLSRSAGSQPGDRAEARAWLEKSARIYREMEKQPNFSQVQRQELAVVEKLLEGIR